MTHIHKLRKLSLLLVAALALTGLFSNRAYATHFRYATIQWSANPAHPQAVTFQMQSIWRWDFPWSVGPRPAVGTTFNSGYMFAFGDGSYAAVDLTVTAVDAANDWMATTATLTHTYAGVGPYTAQFENCCRLSSLLDNNHDNDFILRSIVHLSATTAEQSPTASSLPIIVLPAGVTSTFQIPASDPDGTIVSYAFPTFAESGLTTPYPPGLAMSAAGLVRWTPATTQEGLHAMQVRITDNDGNSVPLDVMLQVIPNQGGTPPTVLINNSAAPISVNAQVGVPVSVQVGATDPDTDPATGLANTLVTLGSGGLPVGGSVAPTMPFTQRVPESANFSWTPTLAQAGQSFTVVFSATDNTGLQASNSLTIHVANPNPPVIVCNPASYAVPATSSSGAAVTLAASVSDPNQLPLTVTWTIDGNSTAVQTDSVAGGTTGPTALSLAQTFTVGSHSATVTATNSFFATSTCNISVDVSKGDQTISFPAIAPLTFGEAPVALSATASSGLPVSFQVVSGPGTLNGNLLTITGAGTITVKASQAGDDTFNPATDVTQDIVVQRATPVITVTGGTFAYDGQPHAATVSVTGPGGTALGPVTVTYNALPAAPINAGTYNVTASFAGDANDAPISGTTTVTINPVPLTIAAASGSMVYGGVMPALTATYAGFVGADGPASLTTPAVLATTAAPGSPVGTYPITVSGASSPNYVITFVNGMLTVTPAALTITADNQTKWFGAAVPPLTVTYAGFVGADTAASLTTPVIVTTTAQALSPSGTYPIVVSGATDPNYTIVFVNGTLTVTGLQQVKASARAAIAALKPTGSRELDHELDEALRDLDASLEPRLWADDSHLTAQGQKVFEEEAQAVRELEEQFRRAPASLSAALEAQADVLVKVDRALAQVEVDEATAAGADARRLADASADILEGDRTLVRKDGDDAIRRYKDAWQDAEQALRQLTDHDGDHDEGHGDHGGDHGDGHGHGSRR